MHNNQHQVQPLRGLDLHFGALRLHYGPCAGRYELQAMKNLILLLIFIPAFCFATGTLKEVFLSHVLADKLGFSVNVKPEGSAVVIKLKGPTNSPSGCPASRSGVFLLGKNGEELLVYITELEKANSTPKAVGYYTSSEHTMGVFIDYICTGTKAFQSIRYSVQSINAWGS